MSTNIQFDGIPKMIIPDINESIPDINESFGEKYISAMQVSRQLQCFPGWNPIDTKKSSVYNITGGWNVTIYLVQSGCSKGS